MSIDPFSEGGPPTLRTYPLNVKASHATRESQLGGLQGSGLAQPLAGFAAPDLAALRAGWVQNVLEL